MHQMHISLYQVFPLSLPVGDPHNEGGASNPLTTDLILKESFSGFLPG